MSPTRLALPLSSLLLLSSLWSGCVIGGSDDAGNDGADAGGSGPEPEEESECYVPPTCDPLSPDCAPNELCSQDLGSFVCTPVPEGSELVGEGEPCGSASCDAGLLCVASCAGGAGCCLPLCDLEQPQCPMGRACVNVLPEGSTQCYAHVGVCEPQ